MKQNKHLSETNKQTDMNILASLFSSFLTENSQRFFENDDIEITIGNMSSDLDSFVSSMFASKATNTTHVVNMKRKVFETKGELMWLVKNFGINLDSLIFLEIPLEIKDFKERKEKTVFKLGNKTFNLSGKNLSLNLVDHNRTVKELEDYDVKSIIDHHQLEKYVSTADKYFIDTTAGSGISLVLDVYRKDLKKLLKTMKEEEKKTLALFLLIPIMMDTKNLKRGANKTDIKKYRKLRKIAGFNKQQLKTLRKIIRDERRIDEKQLTTDILSKDFKIFYHRDNISYGSSTVKYKFDKWVDREHGNNPKAGASLYSDLEAYKKEMNLDFYFVTTKMNKKRYVINVGSEEFNEIAKRKSFSRLEYKGLLYFEVPVEYSRKIMIPEIEEILKKKFN